MSISTNDSTAKTFGQLLLDLAILTNLAEKTDGSDNPQAPALPSAPDRLALLKQWMNDGYAAFANGIDPLGRDRPYTRWHCLDQTHTITMDPTGAACINSDSSRYRLPGWIVSEPIGGWILTVPGSSEGGRLANTSPAIILGNQAIDDVPGVPIQTAIRPYAATESHYIAGFELLVWPRPSAAFVLTGQFRLRAVPMSNVDDRHIFGGQHDYTILQFALLEAARNDATTPGMLESRLASASAARAASIEMDKQLAPRTVGPLTSTEPQLVGRQRSTTGSFQYNAFTYSGA